MYSSRRVKMMMMSPDVRKIEIKSNNESSGVTSNMQYKLVPLMNVDKIKLALLVSLGPYVRLKLQQLYQQLRNHHDIMNNDRNGYNTIRHDNNITWRQKLMNHLIRCYIFLFPVGRSSFDLYEIWCSWKFLMGLSLTFDIPSQVLGHLVRRVTQDDKNKTSLMKLGQSYHTTITKNKIKKQNISNESLATKTWQKPILFTACTIVVFNWITKLRQEWLEYSEQQQNRQHGRNSIAKPNNSIKPIPPPPQPRRRIHPTAPNVCPLCFQSIIHPTASTSGYVFCLKCIRHFILEHENCPITGIPCPESSLVRLYEPLTISSQSN
jgi:hypothetical protein